MERKITLKTKGMHCTSCEKLIIGAAMDVRGVKSAESDYNTETTSVVYDDNEADVASIRAAIEKEGHQTEVLESGGEAGGSESRGAGGFGFGTLSLIVGVVAILIGLYFILGRYVSLDFSSIGENTGIAVLLALGFMTGFHCIGMCGGFVLAYAGKIKKQGDLVPHLQYGAGKTISYAIMGALFGLAGSVIAFTSELRGSIAVIAGLFLVLYGINMLNILPILRRLQPRLPSFMPGWEWGGRGPLVTGLLNGLMLACGPLMALYIFAAGTGSPLAGAKALLFFGLGTLAPMLTFGVVSHYLSAALTRNVVRFSGVMVIVLGLLMASNGLALLGMGLPLSVPAASEAALAAGGNVATGQASGSAAQAASATDIKLDAEGFQVIQMNVTSSGWEPNSFVLKDGVPVKWEINALELNGCNNEILVHDYGLDVKLKPGLQTVEFTPKSAGTVQFSCWMGMIRGQFLVYDPSSGTGPAPAAPAVARGGSCGGGGGCGCGG
jgi:sulfite exporter TauE/SafE/copper chaperone CopZ